jgi:hypothetical protein
MSTELFQQLNERTKNISLVEDFNSTSEFQHCDPNRASCTMLTVSDYVGLLWITLAEFPGILLTILVLDRIGRKKTMCIQFMLFAMTVSTFLFYVEE